MRQGRPSFDGALFFGACGGQLMAADGTLLKFKCNHRGTEAQS